jgi:cysteine desulfurase
VRIDFDHNATTRLAAEVRAAMLPALGELYGNPSSPHQAGRLARQAVETARKAVAAWIGGSPFGVVFTSGGTEADWLAVVGGARGAAARGAPRRVVVSPIEHPAVLSAAASLDGFEVVRLRVDAEGRLDLGSLDEALAGGAALVSVALANHELGTIADLAEISRRARAAGALVHTDAVQAAGKWPLSVDHVDLLSLSAHKINGPKGVGALWVRDGVELAAATGGHQERGRRGGTENLAGIVGMGVAVGLARDPDRVRNLRDRLEAGLVEAGARVHGAAGPRVGNTTNVAFAGVPGELLAMALDLEGVSVATGAACTSGSVAVSPVLEALGVPEPRGGVRFSLGEDNTDEEVEWLLARMPALVERIRASRE